MTAGTEARSAAAALPALRPGDWVAVRSAAEILATLDARGTRDGLPFMPEMIPGCGRRFRLLRWVEKACCELPSMVMRGFPTQAVLMLEDQRCSGGAHGGCQNGCQLLWHVAWLRPAGDEAPAPADPDATGRLQARLQTTAEDGRYFCQATELTRATTPLSLAGKLATAGRDVRVGTHGYLGMVGWIVAPAVRKVRRAIRGEWPRGAAAPTPVDTLLLRAGEWVEVKSLAEITQTLDARGRNRGLHFSEDMAVFCGRRFRVRNRLERLMIESTGRFRELTNTVILEGVHCGCPFTLGGCPRGQFQYWREIWLRRVPGPAPGGPAGGA